MDSFPLFTPPASVCLNGQWSPYLHQDTDLLFFDMREDAMDHMTAPHTFLCDLFLRAFRPPSNFGALIVLLGLALLNNSLRWTHAFPNFYVVPCAVGECDGTIRSQIF